MSVKAIDRTDKDGKVTKRYIADVFSTSIFSEDNFMKMLVAVDDAGLLLNKNKLSDKARKNMRSLIGMRQGKPTYDFLHSTDNTHGKLRKLISCGDHQSPLQQQQDSSVRVNLVMQQFDVAKRLTEAQGRLFGDVSGEMFTTMLTVSRQNTHKGKLVEEYKKHRSRVSRMQTALKDGARNKNGLQLVGGQYLGAFASHEITVNNDIFNARGTTKLYHPHTHILIISDAPLDMDATADVLWKKWQALNIKDGVPVDRKGFKFIEAYDPNAPKTGKMMDDNKMAAVKEAVKYSVKPDIWSKLSDVNDTYQLEVFAEIYNAVKRSVVKQSYGLLDTARNYISTYKPFSSAMSFSITDRFPDIVTQLSELVFDSGKSKHGGYNAFYKRELTPDEIIYYNRGLIEDVLVSADAEAYIESFFDEYEDAMTTRKQQLYAEVFKSFAFERTVDDLLEKLEIFATREDIAENTGKAYDIRLLSNAVLQSLDGDVLRIDSRFHEHFLNRERSKYAALFQKHVAPLSGMYATEENHNLFATFLDKQGLSASGAFVSETVVSIYADDFFAGANNRSDLDENITEFLGVAFFSDDWVNIKK